MVSIKDIAKALSISPSSVSLVLNGKAREKRISVTLAERIKIAADEMGYQPNRAAVSLRTGKSKTIGLIVENISNHFFSSLAHTIEEEARRFHYNVLYCSTENDAAKGREVLRLLYNQQVDGYLIVPTAGMEAEIKNLVKRNRPIVLMDRRLPDVEVPYVMVDNYGGMKQGVEYLLTKGNRRIGFVTVDISLPQMEEREKAYLDVLRNKGIEVNRNRMLKLAYADGKEESAAKISAFLQSQQDLDAVVFATNYIGIYGLVAIRQLGLVIAKDLNVLCFDDHDIFELYQPAITVLRQPIQQIAHAAMEILVAELGHIETIIKTQRLISSQLVIRDSA